jgi:uncharacterized protein (TIGR03437 family)
MKCIPVFLFAAAALCAADFTTGQAARLVIGQETFTSQDTNSSDTILGAASGLAYAADTLFVADANYIGASPSNHRVLLFQNLSTQLPGLTSQLTYNRKCPVCLGQATLVLGQPDFNTNTTNENTTASTLRTPTAVASDGVHLVVADTDHNRVLIWNRIPANNDAPADVAVGQADLVTGSSLPNNLPPTATSMRGPQGVWIQNGKLYVADTQNNRILIWNKIPTASGVAADVVLGQPNFTTFVEPNLTQTPTSASASTMLNPVSVTSDGVRLFVTDLGNNRVLIWNTIPTSNGAAADVEIGQPDMTSSIADNSYSGTPATSSTDTTDKETPVLCTVAEGVDAAGNPLYPSNCNYTLNYPRFALSDGTRLFVADGGEDRVLIFNRIPTANAAPADLILGQVGGSINQASDAADSLRTPASLAYDGVNLYVSDTYNRRVTVYTMANPAIPYGGIVNSGSLAVYATGAVVIGGTIQAGDQVQIGVQFNNPTFTTYQYTYTVLATDTLNSVIDGLVAAINTSNNGTGDPYLIALADYSLSEVILNSKLVGAQGNEINYAQNVNPATSAAAADITASAGGTSLTGGTDASSIAPGTVVTVKPNDGYTLASQTAAADPNATTLPTELGGAQVYFNGIPAPLLYVSPSQINAQVPWEVGDTTSINAYVRATNSDGTIGVTTPVATTIVTANPGIYANQDGTATPPALAYHASSYAVAILSVDGSVTAGDTATITIGDSTYTYTVQSSDTLESVRDAIISQMSGDPLVTATSAGVFTRIIIQARIEGPEGNGIAIGATVSSGANLVLTALNGTTCCANVAGAPINLVNPARSGEMIEIYATGLGVPVLTDINQSLIVTGLRYPIGGPITAPPDTQDSSVSSLIGGKTGDVISATLMPGMVGVYQVLLHLNAGQPADPYTQFWIAQGEFTSNIVILPISTN